MAKHTLKHVWPFYNIMHERVKSLTIFANYYFLAVWLVFEYASAYCYENQSDIV